jgi:hypothetical protein
VLDDLVTLASGFFEARSVKDDNLAPPIPDEPRLLKRSGDERDGRSAHPEHLGQKLLGQGKCVIMSLMASLRSTARSNTSAEI